MNAAQWLATGQPLIPDPKLLNALIAEALEANWLTNRGALHQRLEGQMAHWIGRPCRLVSSGTMALMIALRLGGLPEGAEIITTPLSFAATTQAILWCGFRPVFADVDPVSLTLCPRAAEAAITSRTAAILPVHFLGNVCQVAAFEELAQRRRLWLAYDAAHAFGQTVQGRAVADWGHVSAFSLHATKLMHTGEGGVVAGPAATPEKVARLRNFGLQAGRMAMPGTNGKMSEANAAMGLAVVPMLEAEIARRRALRAAYDAALEGIAEVNPLPVPQGASAGLIYYSISLPADMRARSIAALAEARIMARDYFPLLCGPGTCLPEAVITTTGGPPLAPGLAPGLLSLPFHGRVTQGDVARIADILRKVTQERPAR